MKIFNSDLDNTLIYSYKRNIGSQKKCVEIYNKRDVSFMTLHSLELLKSIKDNICFVPTTTRSIEQYKRIVFDNHWSPKFALVCNGGILLINNEIDTKWYNKSLDMIKDCVSILEQSIVILENDNNRSFEVRNISGLFVFTKSENIPETLHNLKKQLNLNLVDVFNNGSKVYVIPKIINKGNAVKRLKKKLNANYTIAAGDSEFDIPMLKEADLSFAPLSLEFDTSQYNQIIKIDNQNNVFSDKLLEKILLEIKNYNNITDL